MELSKYIKGESIEIFRSDLHFASYNPRKITDENRKALKRGIKKFGLAGGIIVNKRTGNTIVSGHQRISVLDELQKYDAETGRNDYKLRVELIDVEESEEKELNILTNNPNAQGVWDYDQLAELIPDINYKDAGLTDADLSMIGVDYLFQTKEETELSNELEELMTETNEVRDKELRSRAEQRNAITQAQESAQSELQNYEDKVQHMKDVKQQVREQSAERVKDMDAYVMLSFDTFDAKAKFLQEFGLDPYAKFIKGETIASRIVDFNEGE